MSKTRGSRGRAGIIYAILVPLIQGNGRVGLEFKDKAVRLGLDDGIDLDSNGRPGRKISKGPAGGRGHISPFPLLERLCEFIRPLSKLRRKNEIPECRILKGRFMDSPRFFNRT